MQTIQEAITQIKNELEPIYGKAETGAFVRIIFEEVKRFSSIDLHINSHTKISNLEKKRIDQIVSRLKKQEPIQYILGYTEFYELKFSVAPGVLIPRNETEELVHWIISDHQHQPKLNLLDMGTGSGCIAISLAKNLTGSSVSALDISAEAIQIASANAQSNKVSVKFIEADILQPNSTNLPNLSLDVVVSNPPYVTESEKELMLPNVLEHEPHLALFVADDNALLFYRAIAQFSLNKLKPGGLLYFEINEAKANETVEMLNNLGFTDIEVRKDLNGRDRMIKGRKL